MKLKNAKILLVEDNQDDIELTIRAFKKNNLCNDIIVAEDGQKALDIIFNHEAKLSFNFDLILLDLQLPKISGLEVLKRLKAHKATKMIPVIILTSSKEETDLIRSYDSGANSYIHKPVNFINFMKVVNQIGMYWLLLNENSHQE